MANRTLRVVITGDSTSAQRALDGVHASSGRFGHAMAAIARTTALAGALAGAAILKVGTKYQDSLNVFQSVSQATAQQMETVRSKAKALGGDLSLPATSAADAALAMTELVKAGLSVNDTLAASKGVLQLAAAAAVDEATAAEIAANALNSFKLKGDQAGRVADLLAAAANASSGSITDMADALKMSSSVFSAAGISIEDLTTAIGLMANQGIKGSDAGTSLKSMLLALQGPSEKSAKLMARLGLDIYDAHGKMLPFPKLIELFTAKMSHLSQEQRDAALATIFGSDAVRSANVVLLGGAKAFDQMRVAVTRQGAAAEVAAAKMRGVRGAWNALVSIMETGAITIFEKVAPVLESALRGVATALPRIASDAGTAFGALAGAFKNGDVTSRGFMGVVERVGVVLRTAALAVRALLAAFREGDVTSSGFVGAMEQIGVVLRRIVDFVKANTVPVLAGLAVVLGGVLLVAVHALGVAVVGLVGGIVALLSPFVLIVGAVAALTAGLVYAYQHFEGFRNVVDTVASTVRDRFADALAWAQAIWPQVSEAVGRAVEVMRLVVTSVLTVIQVAWRAVGDDLLNVARVVWQLIAEVVNAALDVIRGVIQLVLAVINGDWARGWDGVKQILRGVWDLLVAIVRGAIGLLRAAVGAGLSLIAATFSKTWNSIKDGLATAIGGLVSLAASIPGRIVDAVRDLGGLLYNAGKQVIEGLINGIKDKLGDLKNILGGVAGKIADWKGPIDYDRTILVPAGRAVMDGLITGINAKRGELRAALSDVTADIGVTGAGSIGGPIGAGAAAGAVPQVTVNLTTRVDAAPGVDKRELAELVAAVLRGDYPNLMRQLRDAVERSTGKFGRLPPSVIQGG